jgi:hypothetical protein
VLGSLGIDAGVHLGLRSQKKAARGKEAAEAQAAQGGKVYTTIKDLMDSIVDPSADVVWGAVGTVVDQDGAHETFRRRREEWLNCPARGHPDR